MTFKVLYLVHDVGDPAVMRRMDMLRDGGADVILAGFRRGDASTGAIDLGQTHNGKFLQRILAVIRNIMFLRRYKAIFQNADLVIARNLEMLAIGVRGQALCNKKPALVYECLDIHRLLLRPGLTGDALRCLEGWLASKAKALITSSPVFVTGYFEKLSRLNLPIRLVENKLYAPHGVTHKAARTKGPPWRIGWFGIIRCRDSLRILCNLARRSSGEIEIIIRGRPAYDQFDDFENIVTSTPGVTFLGPYKYPDDLARIYNEAHFTWAIDHFEAGQNSAWLLPNRLYEGGAYNAIPIAEKSVETGRFLDRLNIGVTLAEPLEQALEEFFSQLTQDDYRRLEQASSKIAPGTWAYERSDCEDLVAYLQSLTL